MHVSVPRSTPGKRKMAVVKHFSDFSPVNVRERYAEARDLGGMQFVQLHHDGSPILLQTGILRTVSGVSKDDKFGKLRVSLVINQESIEFQKLQAFDARVLELAATSKWLKTKCPERDEAVIKELYTPTLRVPATDKKPSIRVNFPEKDVVVEDSDKKKIPTDLFLRSGMSKDARMTVILQCTGIWIRGSKFGTSWKVMRILIHPHKQNPIMKFLTPLSPSPSQEDTPSSSDDSM